MDVSPSKLVGERITVSFDFMDELAIGVSIVLHEVSVSVYKGTDSAPEDLLYQTGSHTGTIVNQQIHRGLPGVIYLLTCTIQGSDQRIYKKQTKLAILPSETVVPPLYETFLTSRPYPLHVIDGINIVGVVTEGQTYNITREGIAPVASIISGNLYGSLVTYGDWPPEGINVAGSIQSGTLVTILHTYTIPPEGINISALLMQGSLHTGAIDYTNWPAEGISISASIVSGTLV